MDIVASIGIENAGKRAFELWLEPWGDFVPLAPGESVRVVANASEQGEFEVVWREDGVTVYAWPTTSVRVFGSDGAEVRPGAFTARTPAVPPGSTVRGFLRLVLGE